MLSYLRLLLGLIFSALSGLGLAYSVYGAPIPWLALVAWVPAAIAQHRILMPAQRPAAMAVAWFSYLALAIVPALQPEIGPWAWLLPVGIGALAALLSKGEVADAAQTGYRYFWWGSGAAFTAIEFGRSYIPAQGTWSLAGYALVEAPLWREISGHVGLFGLSLAVWLTNYAVAHLILTGLGQAPRRRSTWAAALFALLSFAVTLWPAAPARHDRPVLRVAAFQVGYDLYQGLWNERRLQGDHEALTRDLFAEGARYTRQAAAEGAKLVVWPEGFLRLVPQEHPQWEAAVTGLARETGAALAVGYVTETPDGRRNEVALITPEGSWHVTGKDHPVPWAETGSVTDGQVGVATVAGFRVGAMICYDADFTDTARLRAAEGLDLLVAPAHDWVAIGRSRLLHVRLRAAENRLPVIMADWMVGSALVDETGQVVAAMETGRTGAGLLLADLPVGGGQPSPYTQRGDLAGWMAVGLMLLSMGLVTLAKRRSDVMQN